MVTIISTVFPCILVGIVYLLVYMAVISLKRDFDLEELKSDAKSLFQLYSETKSHPKSPDLNTLVNSKMFKEQSSKLEWIKKHLQSYVVLHAQ